MYILCLLGWEVENNEEVLKEYLCEDGIGVILNHYDGPRPQYTSTTLNRGSRRAQPSGVGDRKVVKSGITEKILFFFKSELS